MYVLQKIISQSYVSRQLQDAQDGGNCDRLGLYIIVELIAISLDRASMDVDCGFDSGFDIEFDGWFRGGFNGGFDGGCAGLSTSAKHLTAQTRGFYGYQLRGFNGLIVKQSYHFTDSLTAIN